MDLPQPNPGKNLIIEFDGLKVERYPIKTKLILEGDNLAKIIVENTQEFIPQLQGKTLAIAISEKALASTQGRSFLIEDIQPSKIATFLSKHVTKTPVGIGLGSPWTMELAIRDVGLPRILFAALIAAITKPFGIKGMFYRMAGQKARSIDGPVKYALPPFDHSATMGAINASQTAQEICDKIGGLTVAIVDSNDIGVNIIGISQNSDPEFFKKTFKDNPLGQSNEQTPIALIAY
jgi:F420-0:gamma-glutamyl ligase-like protein